MIGSGPAGIAAALALVAQGREVTMLDVGEQLESENAELKARLSLSEPVAWQQSDISLMTGSRRAEKIDSIRPFGSDFLFADRFGIFARNQPSESIGLRPSFAVGGLSNGWGASILPYRAEDLGDWPLSTRELSPHYEALRSFVPVAARPDDLEDLFPMLSVTKDTSLPLTSQARELLRRLHAKRSRLNASGIFFGHARVAVSSTDCRRCGMCLYGCPYGLIFNSSALLDRLSANEKFSYRSGHYVTRFEETSRHVRVFSTELNSGGESELRCERLFIGAGVLPTAQLVLNSLGHFDAPILVRDSQYFLLPLLQSWWPTPDPAHESAHTLTQLFVEIIDPAVDEHTVHTQLYTYNDLFGVDMRARFGVLAGALSPLIDHVSRRLIVAQGFLHSDVSSTIELRLVRSEGIPRLVLVEKINPANVTAISRARKKLSVAFRASGLLPLAPLSRSGSTGSSFHCGGTFSMRDRPSGLESDVLGRPAGLRRVHVVDASVFPSIPATTITLSVMANAHRIAVGSASAD